MRTTLLVLLIAGIAAFFLLAGHPHGTLTKKLYGAPKHPAIGSSCDLPLDWRYAHVSNQIAVAGPYQGQYVGDDIVIGIDTGTFVLTSNDDLPLGENVCVTGNIIEVGQNNSLLVGNVTNILLIDSEIGSYYEY